MGQVFFSYVRCLFALLICLFIGMKRNDAIQVQFSPIPFSTFD